MEKQQALSSAAGAISILLERWSVFQAYFAFILLACSEAR